MNEGALSSMPSTLTRVRGVAPSSSSAKRSTRIDGLLSFQRCKIGAISHSPGSNRLRTVSSVESRRTIELCEGPAGR